MGFENEPSIGGSGLPLFSLVQETAGLLPKVLVYDRRAAEVRTPLRVAVRVSTGTQTVGSAMVRSG